MPFKSLAQRGYLWANHPEVAREFAHATPAGAKLPRHVKGQKRAAGGEFDEALKQTKTACLEELDNVLQTSRLANLMNLFCAHGPAGQGHLGPQLKSSACQNPPPSVISDNLGQPANSERPEPAISFPGQNETMAKMAAILSPALAALFGKEQTAYIPQSIQGTYLDPNTPQEQLEPQQDALQQNLQASLPPGASPGAMPTPQQPPQPAAPPAGPQTAQGAAVPGMPGQNAANPIDQHGPLGGSGMGGLASMQHMQKGAAGKGDLLKLIAKGLGRTALGAGVGAGVGATEAQLIDGSGPTTATLIGANAIGGAMAAQPGFSRHMLFPKTWTQTVPGSAMHAAKGRLLPKFSPMRAAAATSIAGAIPTMAFYSDRGKRLTDKLVQSIESNPELVSNPVGKLREGLVDPQVDKALGAAKDTARTYAPEFLRHFGASAGGGLAGGLGGSWLGNKLGDIVQGDDETMSYEDRRARERNRRIMALIGGLGGGALGSIVAPSLAGAATEYLSPADTAGSAN